MARTKKIKSETLDNVVLVTGDNNPVSFKKIDQPPRLTERQLRLLEVTERDVQNARLVMTVEEQSLRNLKLQASYLDLAIEKQKLTLEAKSAEYENLKKRYTSISGDVFKQHGLNGDRLSYDSETGDIII